MKMSGERLGLLNIVPLSAFHCMHQLFVAKELLVCVSNDLSFYFVSFTSVLM